MLKKYLVTIAMFTILSNYAQIPGNVAGHSLWLESSVIKASKGKKGKMGVENLSAANFNFNPVLNASDLTVSTFKNVVTNQYSFFAVFKSDTDDENLIVSLKKGKSKILVTNKEVLTDNELTYKKVDSKKGIIISYLSSIHREGKKNNIITIEDFYKGDTAGNQQLMEVIYYPRILTAIERMQVETYLSIKYGLSIVGEFNYTNSQNDTIWSFKKNKIYNGRVTGIGRDDALNLYQKQSGNAQKDGIYIGLGSVDTTNATNKNTFKDKTFLLWGDNDGGTQFTADNKNKGLQIMKRTWKMQVAKEAIHDSILTQIRINKKEIGLVSEPGMVLWLAVNQEPGTKFDYTQAINTKQSSEDAEYIYFDNIVWDNDGNGSDLFTFIKGPDFFFTHDAISNCSFDNPGSIALVMSGGKTPYTIVLHSGAGSQKYVTSDVKYLIKNLIQGSYTINVTDSNTITKSSTTIINAPDGIKMSLSPVWQLDAVNQVQIVPEYNQEQQKINSYEWRQNGRIVAATKNFTATEADSYTLTVATDSGCSREFSFTVNPNNLISGWRIYPNPAKSSQPFNVQFNLEKESRVNLRINSVEGKLYADKDLGTIKEYTYSDTLITSGTYLLTITINGIPQVAKLIIH
ncbi:T9SS type A sorting domain-containing protein [Flavobacterium subsaxonicum]|uniref:DUF8202 domain-containing protein n=1 Tax=Flavobacterium subsaxonicum WB 4.1-42 = DSM 21790 TaxID=1121898 RepID=A0A0A2MNA1_9FLAO|nr:T9SS type A sorting domain-containing protein [Flavobacterium subsaxonicum]KGO93794.1 hypothetical protein Q766_07610 [Flavobacterium subsaxonicum WB 4.1-42 = DSM 21790]